MAWFNFIFNIRFLFKVFYKCRITIVSFVFCSLQSILNTHRTAVIINKETDKFAFVIP